MYVETVGRPANVPLDLVKTAARFYGEYLLGKRLCRNVTLEIEFERFPPGSDEYGFCDYLPEARARYFMITLERRLCKREMLMALAHEMVHLKQYARGELKDVERPCRATRWKGEHYHPDKTDYWEQPWEIEAYGREKGLYVKFMQHLKELENT